jgi:ABC-type Fe3+ transport system permease subunit
MISPAFLEQPGRWRAVGIAAGVLVVIVPALPLLQLALEEYPDFTLGAGFGASLARSALVAAGASIYSLALGFPSGLLAGLYRFPGRMPLLVLLAVPLLMPSFLWGIGLSMLRIELGLPRDSIFSGASGAVMSFAALGVPLVLFATLLATRGLPARAVDAARLAGGERAVIRYAGQAALPLGVVAAMLVGLVTLADPGPGQILGFAGVGSTILTSFSALYDFELAARQSLVVAAIVLLAALPLVLTLGRRLASSLLARSVELAATRTAALPGPAGAFLLLVVLAVTLGAPLVGLARPALGQFWLDRVLEVSARTAGNTLVYAIGAGVVATAVALPLSVCAARSVRLRVALLAALMLSFVLPPAVGALGGVLIASESPTWLDPLVRSRLTVAVVLGLRLTPIATMILLRAIGSLPPSWGFAAAVHGVSLTLFTRKLLVPFLAAPAAASVALVALVATADITTVLLLQPPGRESFPVALFTVMANAPESMVASLSLAYILIGSLLIGTSVVGMRAVLRTRSQFALTRSEHTK